MNEIGLDLGVARLGLLDDAAHAGLVEHLAHGHRPHLTDNIQQEQPTNIDLGSGGPFPLYGASLIEFVLDDLGENCTAPADFRFRKGAQFLIVG